MKKRKKGLGKKLLHLFFILCLLGIMGFGLALGLLTWAERHPGSITHQTDAIIVLGAQVYADGSLSPQLELRMEAALASYRENPRPVICCGAKGANEPDAEGAVMSKWLLAQGVPAEHALSETHSFDTIQNLQNAIQMLPEDAEKVTIVTSDYHLPRAMQLARDQGLSAEGLGSPCKPEYWVKNHFREVLAWGKYCLHRMGII